jgi:hypothetical protein
MEIKSEKDEFYVHVQMYNMHVIHMQVSLCELLIICELVTSTIKFYKILTSLSFFYFLKVVFFLSDLLRTPWSVLPTLYIPYSFAKQGV